MRESARRDNYLAFLSLPWAQEVWSSNLHAPTTYFLVFNSILPVLSAPELELGSIWVQIQAARRFRPRDAVLPGPRASKPRA